MTRAKLSDEINTVFCLPAEMLVYKKITSSLPKLIKTCHSTKGEFQKKTRLFNIHNFYWNVFRKGVRSVMQ